SQRDAVRKVMPDGSVTTLARGIAVPDCPSDLPPGTEAPPHLRGLAVDARGAVYVAATGCRCVLKVTPDGGVTTFLRAQSPWSPTGVAAAGGAVYVLEHSNPAAEGAGPGQGAPRVRVVAPDGTVATLATVDPAPEKP